MSEGYDPKITPIPTSIINDLKTSLTIVGKDVKTIKEDLLPPVAKSAREARDVAMELKVSSGDIARRVEALEKSTDHCLEQPRLSKHDEKLGNHDRKIGDHGKKIDAHDGRIDQLSISSATQKSKLGGMLKWFWWLIGVAMVIAGSAITFTTATSVAVATQDERIKSNEKGISDNRAAIRTIAEGQSKVLRAVWSVGEKMEQQVPPQKAVRIEGLVITDDEQSRLNSHQRAQLQKLIRTMQNNDE